MVINTVVIEIPLTKNWSSNNGREGHSPVTLHGQLGIGYNIGGGIRNGLKSDCHEGLGKIEHDAHNLGEDFQLGDSDPEGHHGTESVEINLENNNKNY